MKAYFALAHFIVFNGVQERIHFFFSTSVVFANHNSLVMLADSNYIIDEFWMEVKDSSQQEMLSEILHFSSERSL